VVAFLFAGVTAAQAPPDPNKTGLDRLRGFMEQVHTLRARFRQEIVNAAEEVLEQSSGRVTLSRPGRFRWDYEQPYQRVVVADGSRLWLYEADLEQVTVRPLAAGLGETPADLLTGEGDILERFELVSSWTGEQVLWVRLRPRSADSDFDAVAIGFRGERPVELELHDRLGQQTRLYLSDITLNGPVSDDTFRLTVPEGVDVIREGEL
jgi:outer membrane lipoprotein carrier protein